MDSWTILITLVVRAINIKKVNAIYNYYEICQCWTWMETSKLIRTMIHAWLLSLITGPTLREKCPYSEFFWSVFSTNAGKYGPEKLQIWIVSFLIKVKHKGTKPMMARKTMRHCKTRGKKSSKHNCREGNKTPRTLKDRLDEVTNCINK